MTTTREFLTNREQELKVELREVRAALSALGVRYPTVNRVKSSENRITGKNPNSQSGRSRPGYGGASEDSINKVRAVVRNKKNFTAPQVTKLVEMSDYGVRSVLAELVKRGELVKNDRQRNENGVLGAASYTWKKEDK